MILHFMQLSFYITALLCLIPHLDGIIGDGPGAALQRLFQGVEVHLCQPLHGHLEYPVSSLPWQCHL